MKLLTLLKSHARHNGDKMAHLLPDRTITYRRLWSRIERAAARLQGQWQVQPGEVVAYYGCGHPDSLVLYCALLQIGAQLLPLEGTHRLHADCYLREMNVRLLVHDDTVSAAGIDTPLAHALSDMLAEWCHFDPVIVEENPALPTLWLSETSDGELSLALRAYALQELVDVGSDFPPDCLARDGVGSIFSVETLARVILPALAGARPLQFAAIDATMRSALADFSTSVPE